MGALLDRVDVGALLNRDDGGAALDRVDGGASLDGRAPYLPLSLSGIIFNTRAHGRQ